MGTGFVKMMRTVEANELRKDHKTFTLLSLIADRARRESGCEMHNGIMVCLEVGEAIIGDYKSCGLSEREYRTCKEKLVSMRQITIKTSNKGTIAKLISNTIFDINLDDYQMSKERQANDGQSDRHTDEQRDRQENSVSDSNIIECSNESKQSDGQSDRHTDRRSAAKATTNKNLRIKELNTYDVLVEKIYSLYPGKDVNNQGRTTGKGSNDKKKIEKVLKTGYPLKNAIENYTRECARTKTYLKNFSVFLNNLPDEKEISEVPTPEDTRKAEFKEFMERSMRAII